MEFPWDRFWAYLASFGPFAITVALMRITWIHNLENRRPERTILLYAVTAFSALVAYAVYVQQTNTDEKLDVLTGGDNYCYFALKQPNALSGTYFSQFKNFKHSTIPNIKFGIYVADDKGKYAEQGWSKKDDCSPASVDGSAPWPPGKYRFDFQGPNSKNDWQQFWEIKEDNGTVLETTEIRRGTKTLLPKKTVVHEISKDANAPR